ncbi:MAG: Nif3-like dinuclear metal center hexameric protein [Nocardioidaceae bacterium]
MTTHPTVAQLVDVIERRYPTAGAAEGDAIGLVVGDPAATVERVLFAVDPVRAVVDEAISQRAQALVVHHPLLYRAVQSVAADTPKGRVIHDLIQHGVALYVAHTNADSPRHGVSESMALALGLSELSPLHADPSDPLDKLVTFVPVADAQQVIDALARIGAGHVGDYDRCAFLTAGEGTFRPGTHANPTIGSVGRIEVVAETRIEMVLVRSLRRDVVAALRAVHPYEEPAFDVVELAPWPGASGDGRIGRLDAPRTLRAFAAQVAAALPATTVGARVSGDLDRQVETVAVLGGSGDFRLDDARHAGVDVYVTSDLRHHPASEFREHDGPALIDVPHWAAEWTWLPVAEQVLGADLAAQSLDVTTTVSRICTDPWNHRAARPETPVTHA